MNRLKSIIPFLLSLLTIAALIIYLLQNHEYFHPLFAISRQSITWLIILMALFIAAHGVINWLLFHELGVPLTLNEGIGLAAINSLANQLPFAGGMIAKGVYLKQKHKLSYTQYISATFALYVCFLTTNGVIGLLILGYWLVFEPGTTSWGLLLPFLLMATAVSIFWIPITPKALNSRWQKRWEQLMSGWQILNRNPSLIVQIILIQTLIVIFFAARLFIAFKILSQSASVTQCMLFAAATIITRLVSMTPGGIGIREGIIAGLAAAIGFDAGISVIVVGTERLISTVVIILLGVFYTQYLGKRVLAFDHNEPLKVCYILSYYFPQYVRTQSLIAGLQKLEDVKLFTAVNKTTGLFQRIETLSKLLWIRLKYQPDVFILGFRGYELFPVVRLLTLGKPLIFDHMMSPYDSLIYEKQKFRSNTILARLIYCYEKWILHSAQLVITDTTQHKDHFSTQFQLPHDQIHVVPISTNESLFLPTTPPFPDDCDHFNIFFYGSFLPLHGVDIILQAAAQLKHLPIKFCLVGGHKIDLANFYAQIESSELDNVDHYPWVDYQLLPQHIAAADLCLGGPFGNTPQAQRIITGKTVQFLAMEKPTIVGNITGYDFFEDRRNCLVVPQADVDALSNSIRWAFENRDTLHLIAQQGYKLYQDHFSVKQISQYLELSLNKVVHHEHPAT